MAASSTLSPRPKRWLLPLLALGAVVLLSADTVEAKKHKSKKSHKSSYASKASSSANAAQAASLQAGAIKLAAGQYTFTNVATGHAIHYTADGNNVVPSASGGTPIRLVQHGSSTNWLRLELGMGKTKCLSSQWGGSGDNAAVAYECGHSGLEQTKQWWIIVPEGNTNKKANAHSAANSILLAAQAQADTLHRRSLGEPLSEDELQLVQRDLSEDWADALVEQAEEDDEDDELAKRDEFEDFADAMVEAAELNESEGNRLEKRKKHHKKKKASKKSSKKVSTHKASSSGTAYYIVPTDHLMDSAAVALTASSINTGSAKSTRLSKLANGNKSQLWRITKS